jgi:hypothetical protein
VPDAGLDDLTVHHVDRIAESDARDVVEPALGDLVEGADPGQWQRDPHRLDELAGPPDRLAVAREVLGQRDIAGAVGRRQDEHGLQRQQRRRSVADG